MSFLSLFQAGDGFVASSKADRSEAVPASSAGPPLAPPRWQHRRREHRHELAIPSVTRCTAASATRTTCERSQRSRHTVQATGLVSFSRPPRRAEATEQKSAPTPLSFWPCCRVVACFLPQIAGRAWQHARLAHQRPETGPQSHAAALQGPPGSIGRRKEGSRGRRGVCIMNTQRKQPHQRLQTMNHAPYSIGFSTLDAETRIDDGACPWQGAPVVAGHPAPHRPGQVRSGQPAV
jgi:hypothetical protein